MLATSPSSSDGNAIANWLMGDVAASQTFGLPIVAYEGGQGLNGATDQTNKVNAQTDARMYADYLQYLALWDSSIGRHNLFVHYSYAGAAGQYGAWGALTSQASPRSQKWNALLSLTRLPGDADLDGSVTAADCAIVVGNHGKSGLFWEQGDFNDDGNFDPTDLAALQANYPGQTCTP